MLLLGDINTFNFIYGIHLLVLIIFPAFIFANFAYKDKNACLMNAINNYNNTLGFLIRFYKCLDNGNG